MSQKPRMALCDWANGRASLDFEISRNHSVKVETSRGGNQGVASLQNVKDRSKASDCKVWHLDGWCIAISQFLLVGFGGWRCIIVVPNAPVLIDIGCAQPGHHVAPSAAGWAAADGSAASHPSWSCRSFTGWEAAACGDEGWSSWLLAQAKRCLKSWNQRNDEEQLTKLETSKEQPVGEGWQGCNY